MTLEGEDMIKNTKTKVITGMNVREHFHRTVSKAIVNQCVETSEHTTVYIVNLLTTFTRSNELFDKTSDGVYLKPLVHLYMESLAVSSKTDRNRSMKRLGDVALFVAGIFSNSLNRGMVDVDYYIAMGGNAYSYLSDSVTGTEQKQIYGEIFGELSKNFTAFVDILGEVSEQSHLSSHKDLLRLYEFWVKTDSKRAERQLRKQGIHPLQDAVNDWKH